MNKHISNIKEKAGRHKTLIQNFSYLSALQVVNLLIPLITYPYLIRVLGKETYGLVVFAQAVIGYLVLLVAFGFNISATKEISIHRDNKEKLSEIVSSVLLIKAALFIIAFIILLGLLYFIPQAHGYEELFILCMWACLYDVIFPSWYFQGIEQMKYITYITLVSRLTFIGLIFVFIHNSSDYLFIPIINGVGALLAGVTSLYILFAIHKMRLIVPTLKSIKGVFGDSFYLFLSSSSIQIVLNANKIIIGSLLGLAEVAYYDLGQKILNLLKVPLGLITQVLFPQISRSKNISILNRLIGLTLVFTVTSYGFIWLFSYDIVNIFAGAEMIDAVEIVRILCLSLVLVGISQYLGSMRLIPHGYNKTFAYATISTLFVYLVLILILSISDNMNIKYLSWTSVIVDLWMILIYIYVDFKNGLLIETKC